MGNISQVIPSLHPWLSIPGADSSIHSHAFTALANIGPANTVMFEAAAALARTDAGAATDPDLRERFRAAAYRR
jgi:hypothetical protein